MKRFPFPKKTGSRSGAGVPAAIPAASATSHTDLTARMFGAKAATTTAPARPAPQRVPVPEAIPVTPASPAPTTQQAAAAMPGVTTLTLPETLDLGDPEARARIEDQIRQKFENTVGTDDFLVRSERAEGAAFLWPLEGHHGRLTVLDTRVGFQFHPLANTVTATSAATSAAQCDREGRTLVEWKHADGYYVSAAVHPAVRRLRDTFARALKCAPWDIELAATRARDLETGRDRFDAVVITRMPPLDLMHDRRDAKLRELLALIPNWHRDCTVTEDIASGVPVVTMRFSKKMFLPGIVALADLLPDRPRPDDWHTIPLGLGTNGQPVSLDLTAGPHALAVGPTGTGKTVLLLADVVNRLARGHRIVIIDPTKMGLDFAKVRPWTSLWCDTLPNAQAGIERVYAEVVRRKKVLQELEEVKWSDVDPVSRHAHGLFPLTVVIDEYASLVMEQVVPKSLPKDSPFRLEAEASNVAKAVLHGTVGRIAREARFAGIHLVLAMQRPDASIISGEMRSNLTSAIQLSPPGKPLAREALTMVFPGDAGPQAAEVLEALDDGKSKGLAVTAAEGGTAAGFRVAYTAPSEIPALLEMLDVPKGTDEDILARHPSETEGDTTDPEAEGESE